MNRLLKTTAITEGLTGLALIAVPDLVVRLLLGTDISGAALPLGRVAGVALLGLAVACWFASLETQSRAAQGVVSAMIVYNVGTVLVLGAAGLQMQPTGIALWPAVALHVGMALWCVAHRQPGSRNPSSLL